MRKRNFVAAGITFIAQAATTLSPIVVDAAELPRACNAGSCGVDVNGAVVNFIQSGSASATIVGNNLNVHQTSERAILNWSTFNISADGRVVFQQPGASSVALNRIFGASPSQIFGALEANGQVYLVNQNGFVFGAGSRVKTAGLLASTLKMSDSTFQNGLLAADLLQGGLPALSSDGRIGVLGADGEPLTGPDGEPMRIRIAVEEGAEITTSGSGNRVMLAAQNIDNAGTISAQDGQVLLAAGEQVFLEASTDPKLRGLLVEVNRGGEAWNRLTGDISAARGNVTIAGLAVNQYGRVSASTTVAANGSIRLLARDSVELVADHFGTSHAGEVELGAQSSTRVLSELTDTATAVDDQAQLASRVEIVGRQIMLRGGSSIEARGGEVQLTAVQNPHAAESATYDAQSRIRMEAGASIDVSGNDATAPITRNLVTVELRANELRDAPLQRDGALRGQPVVVDARVGTAFGNVTGALAAVPKTLAERTSVGGRAVFNSEGDIVVADGANIDVSGGTINYTGGVMQTTQLVAADGSVVDIGKADPNKLYVAAINPTYTRRYNRWGVVETLSGPAIGRYEPGYIEGRDAGTLQFASPTMVLNGTFTGTTTTGPLQRDPARAPAGGRFIIGLPDGVSPSARQDHRAPSVNLLTAPPTIVVGDTGTLPQSLVLGLPVDFMRTGGFTRTEIYSNGVVTLPQSTPLNLYAGASLRVVAHGVDINSDISTTGGSINLSSEFTAGIGDVDLPRPGVRIAQGVRLDVSGAWTNDVADSLASTAPLTNVAYRDAGSISLNVSTLASDTRPVPAAELVLGANSQLLANAGAWLQASGTLRAGSGGRISLGAPQNEGVLEIGENVGLQAYGVQGAKGGTFELTAGRLTIESGTAWSAAQRFDPLLADAGSLHLGDGLFSNHGFATFNLTATGATESVESPDVLQVREGSVIDTRTSSLSLLGSLRDRPTGSAVLDFARVALAPEIDRLPGTLSLRVAPTHNDGASRVGRLSVEAGATLLGDARSSFSFSGIGGVQLDGSIFAASGTVLAQLPNPARDEDDAGFLPQLQIEIGANAIIDVSGSALLRPDDSGLQRGEVLPGGTIRLLADRGSVNLRTGSILDVSGASAALDLPSAATGSGYARSTVGSAGGTIELRAPESIVALGNIDAHAGHSDTGSAPAGSLNIQLSRQAGFQPPQSATLSETFPTTPRTIRVVAHEFAGEPGSLNGLALLNVDWLRATGADALALRGGDAVEFESGVSLSMGRSLTVDSPIVAVRGQGTVNLSAPYVAFGYATPLDRGAQNIAGAGNLNVRGDMIELIGATDLVGLQQATFASTGDLRMRSVQSGAEIGGALRIAGDLTLSAARIYPATATRFTVSALGGERDIVRIEQTGTSPGTPLSAAGSVQINAREIVQAGTLLAPFGHIALNAVDSLTLLDGSLTSVSGAGVVVPFGHVQLGEWLYELPGLTPTQATQTAIPARTVELSGAEIRMAATSTVDISGGGDLYAYEWLPGTGGSKDALDPLNSPGLYAILPSLRGQFAPYDPQELLNTGLKPGDSIYLSASDGVAAGVYPLLPARYALLPGAMLVRAVPGTDDIRPGDTTTLPSGAHVVAGYRTFASTGVGDTRYSGFALQPGSYARQLATYQDSLASTFFPARARRLEIENVILPADAGSFVLSPMTSLDARGRVLTAAAAGGRRATIDIAAQNLEITGGGATASPDVIQLDAAILNAWNPSQLLLGARHTGANGTVEVLADTVSIAAGARLALDQIVAIAREQVSIDAGASVTTNATTGDRQLADTTLTLTGEGAAEAAVLAISDNSRITVERPDSTSPAAFGSIVLVEGSQLASRGALLFDAPGAATLAGNIDGAGATWDLVSRRIAFGEEQITDGIAIDSALAGRLQQASTVRLASSGAIDFLASTTLGTGATPATFGIDALTLSAAVIRAAQPGISVNLAANTLTLQGAGAADSQPLDGTGTLMLSADTLRLEAGVLSTEGFGSTSLRANGDLIGDGAATLRVAGPLNLTAARLTTSSGADAHIESTGAIRIANAGTATSPTGALELGGALTIKGVSVEHAGNIVLPSGLVRLEADESLTLASGAVVDVSGRMVAAAGRQVSSWGGTVSLLSGGDIDAAAGSKFLVGGAGDADAGRLIMQAGGAAAVDSQLLGLSTSGARGASFILDAASLHDFAGLNARLESGGFNERRSIHVSSGDLVLDSGASINARFVDLATDQGAVRIAGAINARSDNERSSIGLFGTDGVVLASSAVLRAEGVGAESRGGLITLGASAGDVSLLSGSAISAAGGLQDGRLLVRAPRVGNDVAVGAWAASLSDIESVTIEPVLAFDHAQSVLTTGDFAGYYNAAATYAAVAAPAIRARLAVPEGTLLHVQPGIELRHEGNLSVSALELSSFRFDGEPGALTVRATGAIDVSGVVSDGFLRTGAGANVRVDLLPGRSATVRLIAGSSLASADPTAVARDSASDLTIGAGAVVRTGTGDLLLNAARDIVFTGAGSSVYTGGVAGAPTLGSSRLTTFPTLGGQLQINAGRDIVGHDDDHSAVVQSSSQWEPRQGRLGTSLWGLEVGKFGWNAGTLGGGDLSMSAGRDVREISAAAADSAIESSPDELTRFTGGVLSVEAGGDISSALLHVTHGENRIRAEGALDVARSGERQGIGSLLSIQDAVVDITARSGVALESAFNPTLLVQPDVLSPTTFSTHTERSALHVASASGDLILSPSDADVGHVLGSGVVNAQRENKPNLALLPSSVTLRSLSNDVVLGGDFGATLSPSDRGQLDIFAARDLRNEILLTMSDASSAALPTPLRPSVGGPLMERLRLGTSGRHLGDAQAVLVTAGRNIEGGGGLKVPKAARVIAGRDILNTSLTGQNLDAQDLTLISAGRDLRFGAGSEEAEIQIGGPGRLDVIAGRDIDLGFSHGLSTVGRLVNPDLASDAGADLTVLAGLAREPDASRFVDEVVAKNAAYSAALIDYVAAELSQAPLAFEASALAFKSLDSDAQRPFIVDTFFRELVASGRDANREPELGFTRGFTAIDMLFPGSRPADPLAQPNPYKGDLLLAFSRIYTVSGGTISLLAPGGLLNVGLANPPAGIRNKPASELGIVAQRAGDVRSFTDGDVLVNSSRVFTLGGGDIAIWSTTGDIDAGRGSKSAISVPPPAVLVDASGKVTLDFAGAVAGSGIRTILAGAVTKQGDVDLIAPAGTVNAGDAGIASARDINIAAQNVVGLDNIQVGGTSTGVPAETSSLGASLSGVSGVASSAASSSSASVTQPQAMDGAQQSLAASALSWLEVFVVGLGEEGCSPKDVECLKRQAPPASL